MAMVELDQMKFELQSYENTLHEVKDSLDLEGKKKRIEELEMEMEASRLLGSIRIPPTAR